MGSGAARAHPTTPLTPPPQRPPPLAQRTASRARSANGRPPASPAARLLTSASHSFPHGAMRGAGERRGGGVFCGPRGGCRPPLCFSPKTVFGKRWVCHLHPPRKESRPCLCAGGHHRRPPLFLGLLSRRPGRLQPSLEWQRPKK